MKIELAIAAADREDQEARDWVLRYQGDFEFLRDVRDRLRADPWYELSPKQTAAILRCKAREEAPRTTRGSGVDISSLPTGTRYYAVPNSEDKLTFFRVDHVDEPGTWLGWLFVHQVVGGSAPMRIGKQRPGDTYEGQWSALLQKIVDDPQSAMQTYGREIGRCGMCGKTLTDELSRERGIGPVCWEGG